MKVRKDFLGRITRTVVITVLSLVVLPAHADLAQLYIAPESSTSNDSGNLLSNCTNETGGLFQAASVNVGNQVDFSIQIGSSAPQGGVKYTVTSTDSNIVAAIDPATGGVPTLFIPEGQRVTTTTFRIVGNQIGRANLNLSAAPSRFGFVAPVTGWDVGEVKKRFVDANPPGNHCRAADDDPNLSTDSTVLANCGNDEIKAVATDGETPVLLRLSAGLPGEGCFEIISSAPPEQGRISADVVNTLPDAGFEYAFSFYFPPDEFVDSADSRTVEMEFTYTPNVSGRRANTTRFSDTLKLVRPPVVLMHGLWADDSSWKKKFINTVKGSNGIIEKGNYSTANAEEMTTNLAEIVSRVDKAIKQARKQKIAATKVDYIGHSMGGLLGRLHISDSNYEKPENLGKGDIRRFVTLNTPHFGSNFASLIIMLHDFDTGALSAELERDIASMINLTGSTGQSGRVTNGAICDLAENSAGLSQLSGNVPMAHAYTSTGGPAGTPANPALFLEFRGITFFEETLTKTRCIARNLIGFCKQSINVYPQAVVDAFRFRQANDGIVPLTSQLGGLTGSPTTNNPNFIHFGASFFGTALTEDKAAAQTVRGILDAETSSNQLATLQPVQSMRNGAPLTVPGRQGTTDIDAYATQCATGGVMNNLASSFLVASAALTFNPSIQILSPSEDQVFAPGDILTIDVNITDPKLVSGAEVSGLGILHKEDPPYQMSVTIPEDVSGRITLSPSSHTYDGSNFSLQVGQPVNIIVRRSAPPDDLLVDNYTNLRIPQQPGMQKDRVLVKGIYNGVEVSLNDPVTGTTFVSSDTNVVSVDSEGVLTPGNFGHAVIIVANSGVTGFAIVEVGPVNGAALPPQDVTQQLILRRSGIRLNRRTGFFTQRITITNPADIPVPGPLALVLSGLPSGVIAVNRDNNTDVVNPGSAQFDLPVDQQLNSLLPGAQVTFDLEFVNPNRQRINYTPQVFIAEDI